MQSTSKAIIKAWHDMIENQNIDDSVLRPEIASSWKRSRDVIHFDITKPKVSDEMIQKKKEKYSELISIAHPLLEELSTMLENSIVFLTDREGIILDVIGNNELCPVGCCLQESKVGTNAVGTALIEKKTLALKGYEHYRRCMHSFDSVAAPIWFESEIVGILCWTSIIKELPDGYIQIAEYVAKTIEISLKRFSERTSIIDATLYGTIIIDEHGKIYNINKSAVQALGLENRNDIIFDNLNKYVINSDALLNEIKNKKFEEFGFRFKINNVIMNCTLKAKKHLPSLDDSTNLYLFAFTNHGREKPDRLSDFSQLVGSSNALTRCKELALKASRTSLNILINGESGTGKELLTQAIHKASNRKGPLIPINCGAIPKDLLQSELFGYEEGSFTGAKKGGAIGKFELADGGTIFLDEIGEMPLAMQVSLLRFLQDKTVYKVGSNKSKLVDVRVIAATNRNLEEAIANSTFREDLYYRLNVINITLPPLRHRTEDIPELVESFIDQLYANLPDKKPSVTEKTYEILTNYYWPGNVRELRNVMEYAIVFSDGASQITPECLPARLRRALDLEQSSDLRSRELVIINKALADNGGNISQTARVLGITRSTLYRKLKEIRSASPSYQRPAKE
jgi:transcriptional regulator with PAS, ATPase and Fis domain